MGTIRCGRFLVTYSYLTSPSLLSPSHEYRLHWWLHHPFKQATKVAEVKLFSDQAINNIITIGIAQWPNVNNRLIIYGYRFVKIQLLLSLLSIAINLLLLISVIIDLKSS